MALEDLRGYPLQIEWREAYADGWRALLEQVGIPYPMIVNGRTGRVLSPPHMRLALEQMMIDHAEVPRGVSVANGVWCIPALVSEWDEQDENRIALILAGGVDHTLVPGVKDSSAINILLELTKRSLDSKDMRGVMSVGVSIESLGAILDELSYEPTQQLEAAPALDSDTWDIPQLNLAMQVNEIVYPVVKYGTRAKAAQIEGMYHFYTPDKRFRALVDNPTSIMQTGCSAAVEPNFSTSSTMPAAIALYRIYQKRTISTTWQNAGLPVMVDLNVDRRFFGINLLGVPKGWRSYANRAYQRDLDHLIEAYDLACERRGSNDVLYMVYGAGQKARALCESRGWHWIPEDSDVKRGRFDGADGIRSV